MAQISTAQASTGQPSIRVSTTGKSTEQLRAEVRQAAIRLCDRASQGAIAPVEAERACVRNAVREAFAQSGLEQPTTLAKR